MNPLRAKHTTDLRITAKWLAHVLFLYRKGMEHSQLDIGDSLERDWRWVEVMESNLVRSGFWNSGTIATQHRQMRWTPELEAVLADETKAGTKLYFQITMEGLARLHDRCLRGMQHSGVLGDALAADYRWIGSIERELLGNGYLDAGEIRKRHEIVNPNWKVEYDMKEAD